MKVLFVISSSETAFWLSEVTHPYWHLTERGERVDLPARGEAKWSGIRTVIRISKNHSSLTTW